MTDEFDAIVVGSGLNGGIAAYALTKLGIKTCVLEAGPPLEGGEQTYGTPLSNLFRQLRELWWTQKQGVQRLHPSFWQTNPNLFVDDRANPYTTPEGKPYHWIRGRQVGGRSHTWGGVCLRFSKYDFMANEIDGKGTPWPLQYDDLAPFYDRVEKLLEVHGERDGIPTLPDGHFLPASPFTHGERYFQSVLRESFNRALIISRGIRAERNTQPGEVFSRLSSNQTSLGQAQQTGHLTLRSGAIVSRLTRGQGRVSGVEYIDAQNRETRQVKAKLVILCPSTIETVRLLLNSGIGNSSGLLGKGLADHHVKLMHFLLPGVPEQENFKMLGSDSVIIPRYANLFDVESSRAKDFTRGYGFWGGISRTSSRAVQRRFPGQVLGMLCCMGEALPAETNRITVDAGRADAWGIPVPHIEYQWQKEDLALGARMFQDAHDMVTAAKGRPVEILEFSRVPFFSKFMAGIFDRLKATPPGIFVHEVGGARMGTQSDNSVTNAWGQLWDSPNVILGDGSVFPSAAWQNPSLTEMALCLRAVEASVKKLQKGEL